MDNIFRGGARETERGGMSFATEQALMEYLIDSGFMWDEALLLLDLREHLYESPEMRQRMKEDCRMHFARYLYEQGEISEW